MNQEYPDKTMDLSQVTDKRYRIMLYTSPWTGFELTTLVVIGTDCRGSCKSNYHTITTTAAPGYMEFKLNGNLISIRHTVWHLFLTHAELPNLIYIYYFCFFKFSKYIFCQVKCHFSNPVIENMLMTRLYIDEYLCTKTTWPLRKEFNLTATLKLRYFSVPPFAKHMMVTTNQQQAKEIVQNMI